VFHDGTCARLSANARGSAVSLRRAAVPQAVDQSSMHNKRNDRLEEGHGCVARAEPWCCVSGSNALFHLRWNAPESTYL
jgi:hypothetical protein